MRSPWGIEVIVQYGNLYNVYDAVEAETMQRQKMNPNNEVAMTAAMAD